MWLLDRPILIKKDIEINDKKNKKIEEKSKIIESKKVILTAPSKKIWE
jgi:hypothetical protein